MDIVDSCKSIIEEKLQDLESIRKDDNEQSGTQSQSATQGSESQTFSESYFFDPDKNLNKILNQQTHLKRIIDQDNELQMLKSRIVSVALETEGLRRQCTKQNEDALTSRQELAATQAKELEKFQMGQIKSIAEDYNRHQEILEQRKKEIQSLNKEIEKERTGRQAYLADVEKKLEQQLQERQSSIRGGGALPFPSSSRPGTSNLTDDLNNPNHIELTSIDEYAPYGEAPHSRPSANARGSRGRGGRARGRRKRG